MKSNHPVKRKIITALFAAAVTLGCSSLFAQVKIGTSPTTIDANSNLEVQAANNKKVIIHKDNGTVVIENTPSGAITDSLLTRDLIGNVRSIDASKLRVILGLAGSGSMSRTTNQLLTAGGHNVADFTTILADDVGSIDLASNEFIVKKEGTYSFSGTVKVLIPGASARANVDISIQKFNGSDWDIVAASQGEQNAGGSATVTVSLINNFLVGDRLRLLVVPCFGCIAGNPNFTLLNASFYGVKHY